MTDVPVWTGVGLFAWYTALVCVWIGLIITGSMLIRTIIAYIRGY